MKVTGDQWPIAFGDGDDSIDDDEDKRRIAMMVMIVAIAVMMMVMMIITALMMVMAAQEKMRCHIPFSSITQFFRIQQAGHTDCACAQLIAFVCTASRKRTSICSIQVGWLMEPQPPKNAPYSGFVI